MQTFSLIKIENIKINHSGLRIGISDIIKTSAVGHAQPVLFLLYFEENRAIFPATALEGYMKTKHLSKATICNLILRNNF